MKYICALLLCIFPLTLSFAQNRLQEQARSYREEGYKLQQRGDFKKALVFYQKAAELDPSYVEVINDLGVVYEDVGDDTSALAMYKRALDIDPHYLPAHTNLAFLYERQGNIDRATHHWRKRYELGVEGEYWREVARQHLLQLGTYPQIMQEILEKKAADLSRELVTRREQQRLQTNDEARVHFDIGAQLRLKGEYVEALKEFEIALSLNPSDEALQEKISQAYQETTRLYIEEQALLNTQEALTSIKKNDFLAAGQKLQNALSAVYRITREK